MATLKEHNENVFKTEHQRLFRALIESRSRETQMNRKFRQMKEELVSVSLRLQVASELSNVDFNTIKTLRHEITDSRSEALIAQRQFNEAQSAILSLKREIASMKRKLKDNSSEAADAAAAEKQQQTTKAISHEISSLGSGGEGKKEVPVGLGGTSSFAQIADGEVDKFMSRKIKIPLPNGISTNAKTTTFQEWKMQRFLYAPDTLAASKNHDKTVVDLLNKAASEESFTSGDVMHRTTRSVAAKSKPLGDDKFAASVNRREGTDEEIAKSLASIGVILPSMRHNGSPGKLNLWATHTGLGGKLSSPPKSLQVPKSQSKKVVI